MEWIGFSRMIPCFLYGLSLQYINRLNVHCVSLARLQTVGDRAFCVAAAKTRNSLPSQVTSSVTLSILKHKLKTYLFFTVISQHVISPHIDVQ